MSTEVATNESSHDQQTTEAVRQADRALELHSEAHIRQVHNQEQTRYEKVLANLAGMIYQFRLDRDGLMNFTHVSVKSREIYEIEPEAMATMGLAMIHAEDLIHWRSQIHHSARTLENFHWEGRIINPTGKIKWIRAQSSPERLPDGVILWDGIIDDISDRKQLETDLQESQKRFKTLVDETPGVLYRCQCDRDWTILFISNAIEKISGYPASDFIENKVRTFASIIHPEDAERVEKIALDAIAAKEQYLIEYRILRADGSYCWVYEKGQGIFTDRGDLKYMDGIVIDNSDSKEIELKLQQQTKDLENALQELQRTQSHLIQGEKMSALGQLVAGVAHEINNPVNFIYGNLMPVEEYVSDLLSALEIYNHHCTDLDPEIEEELEDLDISFLREDLPKVVNSMKEGARRIREIVLSLRTFSRLDEAELKNANIHEGIDSTLTILHYRLKAKPDSPGIQVVKNYGNLPPLNCYTGQLNQVFMNILGNAIDALEERDAGKTFSERKENPSIITITTELNREESLIKIKIRDNGTGIPEKLKNRVFDPFFTTKAIGKGTGLGMSISYQIIVEKHSGNLSYASPPEGGTEFIIELPLSRNR